MGCHMLAVDGQIAAIVTEIRLCGLSIVRLAIQPCHRISFPYSPNRATLQQPVKVGPSTGSAPRPRGRLTSRKRTLLGGLVFLKEPEPRHISDVSSLVSSGSSKSGSQRV